VEKGKIFDMLQQIDQGKLAHWLFENFKLPQITYLLCISSLSVQLDRRRMAWKYLILWRNVQRTAIDDILGNYTAGHMMMGLDTLKNMLLENSPRTIISFSITIKNTSSYHFSDEQFMKKITTQNLHSRTPTLERKDETI
jgi:hypothetical protein